MPFLDHLTTNIFQYLNRIPDTAFEKYENIIVHGDINIDIKHCSGGKSELYAYICETFSFI